MAGIEQIVATAWEYRDKRQQAAFSRALREIAGQGKLVKTGQSIMRNEGTGQYWGTYCGCNFHSPYARDYHVPWPPPRDSEIACWFRPATMAGLLLSSSSPAAAPPFQRLFN